MNISFKEIQSPEDISLFKSFTSSDLNALVVFRTDSGNLRPFSEINKCTQWMEMALGSTWDNSLTPRHHSNIESSDSKYRSSKICELINECNDEYVKSHVFFEFETKIDGKSYYCIAAFKSNA